jgi:hypothetical protein
LIYLKEFQKSVSEEGKRENHFGVLQGDFQSVGYDADFSHTQMHPQSK